MEPDTPDRAEARRRAPSLWWAIVLVAALIVAGVLWASQRESAAPAPPAEALSTR